MNSIHDLITAKHMVASLLQYAETHFEAHKGLVEYISFLGEILERIKTGGHDE